MNWEKICKQVVEISTEVRLFIIEQSRNFDLSKIEMKGMNDLVSYVDREAEQRIVEKLRKILPQSKFIAEENPDFKVKTQDELHWIIDPLDGTTNFLHGLPIYAISIGLQCEDKMIVGIVHEINKDECFAAWQGGGAYCNGQPIRVSPIQALQDSLLATGFPYRDFDQVPAYLDIIKELMRKTHGLRRMGSAAVDLAYTAMGRFQGFFEYNLNAWDVAAGALLVQEAGGRVTDFSGGEDFVFGKQIVAGCAIQPAFLEVIQKHWGR
jgi:myo-inositol-1(or 4)-monophosphatase